MSIERELAFVDNLCDGLMDVAAVYGPYWEPFFRKMAPNLLEYLVQLFNLGSFAHIAYAFNLGTRPRL